MGRSNVGKSSLINALTGRRQIARVSKTPGKTRTCNVYDVAHRWYLVDLPGYGYARASHQDRAGFQALLADYLGRRAELAAAIWLLDVRHDPSADDVAMAHLLARRQLPLLAALTKVDKIPRGQRAARAGAILQMVGLLEEQGVLTSVKTREGIRDLRASIEVLVTARRAGPA